MYRHYKISKIAALIGFSAALGGNISSALAQDANVPRTAFVHLFEWPWADIATECETVLGPKGYSAVQVSPPNLSIDGSAWWTRYQPVSYEISGRSGDRNAFINMVQRCKTSGVDIYVDAVINHMAAWNRDFPRVPYSSNDFNNCTTPINYQNRWQVQNCDLSGLNDLKTGSDYVRQKIADYLNDMTQIGVAGFRIDAAKHIPNEDIAAIKSKLTGSPYIFQEVIGAYGEPITPFEYTGNGDVTEFGYERAIGDKFQNGGINELKDLKTWPGMLPSDSAVVFVANHDDERHNEGATLTHLDVGDLYYIGNIFMLAYPYGYPKVMSGYYFGGNFDQGPPSSGANFGNACGFDGGDWVCEHRWRGIANMVSFRNHTANEFMLNNWWDDGYNQIAFGRGSSGFVVINRDDNKAINRSFQTGMPAGEYCDIINGNYDEATHTCSGPTISVNAEGMAYFTVNTVSASAIHIGAKIGGCSGSECNPDPNPITLEIASTAVCLSNDQSFTNPTVYFWGSQPSERVVNATWPGESMVKKGNYHCYDLGAEVDAINIIFNDNGVNQTEDLRMQGNHCYDNGTWKSLVDCGFNVTISNPSLPVSDLAKVCYDNNQYFDSPTIYYWNVVTESGNSISDATWPGVPLTQVGNQYCYEFAESIESLNLIFSNNGSNQSSDLSTTKQATCYKNNTWTALDNCI
ncbi:MAG: starch-binding protein [Vibrio litoralis]|uniref:starch-binding protein n=1 Tax=Vibrio litoralis TaxID=335972 RepID=UPI003F99D90E